MGAEVPEPDEAAPRLATVIGKNAHRLRTNAGLTLDQVSIAARMRGLNWSESRVADFEAERVAPNLATLIAVCLALADAGCSEATFHELLRSQSPMQINDSLLLSSEQVVNLLSGRPTVDPFAWLSSPESLTATINASFDAAVDAGLPETLLALTEAPGATEERTWKALGISPTELADWSTALWNRTFSEERDRRAGQGANAQKRGQVTRHMRAELEAAIRAAKHGDGQ